MLIPENVSESQKQFCSPISKIPSTAVGICGAQKPPDKTSCGNVLMCQTRSQAIMIPPVSLPSIEMQAGGHQQLFYDKANH